ncbi:MAG: THUMP domain-containing protein [Bacteroides sp.]|nr:THUMP domain-containing protein [Bacteroides sp.]MCM1084893.1 THUMP domain-containing protein [Bacteroides sp.]
MPSYIAKTLQGLEPVLAKELKALGATDVKEANRAVLFEGNQKVLYKANYLCRTALRILRNVKSFDIKTQDDLYDQVYDVPWEKIFPVDALMTLSATCIDSVFSNTRFAAQRIKDAIVDRFRRVFGQRPTVDNEFYTIRVELFMRGNHCELLLDSSGLSLHNRGYQKPHSNSFSEVLASGLLALSGWTPDKNLLVPFCGNGLLAIEAAMQASNMPAGYYRKGYSFQYWNDFDPNLWKEIKDAAIKEICDPQGEIIAIDSDGLAVEETEARLKKIRLHLDVNLQLSDFMQGVKPEGLEDTAGWHIVIRMPKVGSPENFEAEDFYTEVGDVLKRHYTGAQAWIFSTEAEVIKFVGLKPDRKLTVWENKDEGRFYGYKLV